MFVVLVFGIFDFFLLQELGSHLQREGRVWKEDCLAIIRKVTEIISNEPNLLRLNDPITGRGFFCGLQFSNIRFFLFGGVLGFRV